MTAIQPDVVNLAQNATRHSAEVDAAPLHVVTMGSGHPIVLLHGWGQSLLSLQPLGQLLSRFMQVHLIDLPGFGQSPIPTTDWTTCDYARRIESYLSEKDLAGAIVVGHSFGGRIAVQIAARNQADVKAIILINAHGIPNTNFRKAVRGTILKYTAKTFKTIDRATGSKFFLNWFVPRFASADYKNSGRLKNILVKTVNENLSTQSAQIKISTLLLWGGQDQETPPSIGRRYHELIEKSRLIVMPNKNHFPFQNGGEHLCARYILDFLADLR